MRFKQFAASLAGGRARSGGSIELGGRSHSLLFSSCVCCYGVYLRLPLSYLGRVSYPHGALLVKSAIRSQGSQGQWVHVWRLRPTLGFMSSNQQAELVGKKMTQHSKMKSQLMLKPLQQDSVATDEPPRRVTTQGLRPCASGSPGGSLVNILLGYMRQIGASSCSGPLFALDQL